MNLTKTSFAALSLCCACAPALALDFTMDFDNIPRAGSAAEGTGAGLGSEVLGFYNGDPLLSRDGSKFYDVTFSAGALAINSLVDVNGAGNFEMANSGLSAIGTLNRDGVFGFALEAGLSLSKISFFYNGSLNPITPTVELFSAGQIVGSTTSLALSCEVVDSGEFCVPWLEFIVDADYLDGKLVDQVRFIGAPNLFAVDDISLTTVGVPVAIPEPSTYALMTLGLALVAGAARRRTG